MSNNWEVYTLREISRGKGQYGIAAPGIPYDPNLTRYLRITDITDDGFLIKDNKVSVDVNSEQYEKYILKKNDIVFARTGASAGRSYVYEEEAEPLIVAGFLIRYALNPEIVNPRFMRYYTISSNYKGWVAGVATGSTRPNINEKMLSSMEVKLPPLSEQNRIVQIFDSLEHKLKNNNNIIANLEEQAQTIFKSWFVDFEPFQDEEFVDSELGSIPKACKVEYLLDLIEFKGGSQPPKKEHIYEYKDGYVRFIQNRDYNGNNNHLTYIKESKKNRYADRYDILMDKYGEAGKTRYGIEGAYNVALAKIKPNNISLREYIRRFLEQDSVQDYIYNSSMASTRPSVNKKSLGSIKLVIPPKDILKKFDDFSFTIIESILKYQDMNKKLAEIRDTLLPKLMSGEIRVEEAIEVEEM